MTKKTENGIHAGGLAPRATTWRQAALAAALACLPWLSPFATGPSPAVLPWLVSAACAMGLWIITSLGGGRPVRSFALLLAAIGAWALVVTGMRPEVAMLAGGLVVAASASSVRGEAGPPSLARAVELAWLAAAALSAVIGLLQYFGATRGLPFVNSAQPGEAYGNLRQPNQFATLCSIGVAVLLWGGVRLPRPAAFALAVLLAIGSAASASRTGLVQGVLLGAMVVAWGGAQRRGRLAVWAIAAVAYLAAALLLPLVFEAMWGFLPERTLLARLGTDLGCSSRRVLWSNVLHLIAQKPLTGWGWGELDYAHYLTLYPGARFCDILDNAHDLPLHLAVELGVPAALLVCAALLVFVLRRRPWREELPRRQLAWAVLALIGLHSLLEYPLWYGPFQIALGVAVGWLGMPAGEQALLARPARRRIVVACLLLAATGYAAWDYIRVSQIYGAPDQRLPPWREDTLAHVRRSWLFSGQAGFADLTLASVDRANAQAMQQLARRVLHYSPEPRVIERLVESETMLGRTDEAVLDLARYRAAFPKEYAAWRNAQKQPLRLP